MQITFDELKDATNQRKHGISLARAAEMDLNTALTTIDDREDYGEVCFKAIGFLNGRLHTLIFTESESQVLRAISLRRATRAESEEFANG